MEVALYFGQGYNLREVLSPATLVDPPTCPYEQAKMQNSDIELQYEVQRIILVHEEDLQHDAQSHNTPNL